jgi:hypothetical protein
MSDIDINYAQLGSAGGFLGAPTTLETAAPDGTGRFRHYAGARFIGRLVPAKEIENELK